MKVVVSVQRPLTEERRRIDAIPLMKRLWYFVQDSTACVRSRCCFGLAGRYVEMHAQPRAAGSTDAVSAALSHWFLRSPTPQIVQLDAPRKSYDRETCKAKIGQFSWSASLAGSVAQDIDSADVWGRLAGPPKSSVELTNVSASG